MSPEHDFSCISDACLLPTIERPLRLAEFDDLFRHAVLRQDRLTPTRLRWRVDPIREAAVRDLAARETSCCSFFGFTYDSSDDTGLPVDVEVPAAHVAVLDALQARAAAVMTA